MESPILTALIVLMTPTRNTVLAGVRHKGTGEEESRHPEWRRDFFLRKSKKNRHALPNGTTFSRDEKENQRSNLKEEMQMNT